MRTFLLPHLASLLLKNHYELRDLAGRLSETRGSPFNIALNLGAGAVTTMSVEVVNGKLHLQFKEGMNSYLLELALKPANSQDSLIKVTLFENGKQSIHSIAPADFVGAQLPEKFKGIHEQVVQYLKSILPANFFDQSTAVPEAAEKVADAVQAEAVEEQERFRDYRIIRENAPDLRFSGKEIGSVETWPRNGRQHQYKVFQTKGGKFVGLKLGKSMWLGEGDRAQVQVEESLSGLVAFFGHSSLSKVLYQQLGLANEEFVE